MRNFIIGLIVGILACGLALFILIFAAARFAGSFANRPVNVAEGSTLVLDLEGDVPERLPAQIPIPLLQNQQAMSLEQVWLMFRKAAGDPRIKAVLFEPSGLTIGWGKMEEIHHDILEFKKSGKPIITYLKGPTAREYYLASATDKIFLSPEDTLDLKGLSAESMYFKDTLDKVGVQADVIHAGKYKDAGDVLTRTSMTPETREVLNDVLDQYYGDLIATVAQGRKKPTDAVQALINQGPFLAKDAVADGLIDSLGYEDQAVNEIQKRLNQKELKRVAAKPYLRAPLASMSGGRRIALVVGQGMITSGSADDTADADSFTGTGFIKLLKQVENDSSIQGVILRIDSPGGDGVASDDILHEAKNLSRKKPMVISMGDEAASGGYYVAMTGDPIVAYPNTLTGSIGVLSVRFNVHGLFDKVGVSDQILSRGKYAQLDSISAPLTNDEREKITDEIQAFYSGFVSRVAQGRKKPYDQIEPLAQGRVWLGEQAKKNGLVDQLGGLDRAIELLKQRAHIPASARVTLVPYPGPRSILQVLFQNRDNASADMESRMAKIFGRLPWQMLASHGYLKLMPYTIRVQ